MDFLLAILYKELVVLPRRRFFRWQRVALVAAGAGLLGWGLSEWQGGGAPLGLLLFQYVGYLIIVAAAVGAPLVTGYSLYAEREGGVLPLVMLTDISPAVYLGGKLLATALRTGLMLLSLLPLVLLAVALGGVSAAQLLAGVALVAVTLLVGTAVGLLSGSLARSENRVLGWALLPTGGILVVAAIAFMGVIGDDWEKAAAFFAAAVVLGLLFFALGLECWRYQMARLASPNAPADVAVAAAPGSARKSRRRAPPPIGNDPIYWRELQFRYRDSRFWLWWLVLTIVVPPALAMIVAQFEGAGEFHGLLALLLAGLVLVGLFLGVPLLAFATRCARLWRPEQQNGMLPLLLVTDLTPAAIVRGKVGALLTALWPLWLAFLAITALFGWIVWWNLNRLQYNSFPSPTVYGIADREYGSFFGLAILLAYTLLLAAYLLAAVHVGGCAGRWSLLLELVLLGASGAMICVLFALATNLRHAPMMSGWWDFGLVGVFLGLLVAVLWWLRRATIRWVERAAMRE